MAVRQRLSARSRYDLQVSFEFKLFPVFIFCSMRSHPRIQVSTKDNREVEVKYHIFRCAKDNVKDCATEKCVALSVNNSH